jgi:hypothetical protein
MGNSQGRDNVKKRAARRKKTERLALAKKEATKKAKKVASFFQGRAPEKSGKLVPAPTVLSVA